MGTRNVLTGAQAHGAKRVVYLSTPSLYFDYHHRLGSKVDPLPEPVTDYAATKLIADREVKRASDSGLPIISLRPRAIFGPGDQAVLVRVIRAAAKGTIPLVGGGKSFIDLTYIDNTVDAVLLCLDAPARALGRVFNVTNGEPLTSRGMMEMLFSKLDTKARFRPLPFPLAYLSAATLEATYKIFRGGTEPPLTRYSVGLMAKSQTLDISAAREVLGFSPRVTLEEGMERFARWWRKKEEGKLGALEALGLETTVTR